MTQWDVLVYVGRFQPFHHGHAALLTQALQLAKQVIVVVGSACNARSVRNPFTAAERRDLILAAMPGQSARLRFVAMRDYYDTARWAAAVQGQVAALLPAGAKVALFGHAKDMSSDYLQAFPGWPLLEAGNVEGINATDLRAAWFGEHGDTRAIANRVAEPVRAFMQGFANGTDFFRLQAEHDYLAAYRTQWRAAPYAPIFVTVDAVVSCCQHVLLVQRGGMPGRGNWALPGGFLDQYERVAQASLRELVEETRIAVDLPTLQRSLRGQHLFDHPERSLRGRTLTHAFHYALDLPSLPAIQADDDAAAAQWLPLADLPAMERQMHDDHFMILDHFLDLIDEKAAIHFE